MLVEGMHYSTSASYSRERRFEALSRAETSRSTIGRINREEGNGVAREAKERLPGFRWAISRLVDRTLKKADVPRLILGRMVSCPGKRRRENRFDPRVFKVEEMYSREIILFIYKEMRSNAFIIIIL